MHIFSSTFGKVITIVVTLLMVAVLGTLWWVEGFTSFLSALPATTLVVYLVALLYWFPKVEVSNAGVLIVNPLRSHQISWNAIGLIDTKYSLTITAKGKKISAWATPAPGRHTAIFATKDQGSHLPESTYLAGTVRPGDLVNSESGAAAAHIRRLWEQRDQGSVESLVSRWNLTKILILGALLIAVLASY